MWGVALKVRHRAAMLGGAITAAWMRGGKGEIGGLAKEARRLGVEIRPLDVDRCGAGLTLEREGAAWAIAWGLALLPGWNREVAERFLAARPKEGFKQFSEVARAAAGAGMSNWQLEALVRSGGCDRLGGRGWSREALVEAVGPVMEWARRSNAAGEQRDLFSAVFVEELPVEDDALLEGVAATPGVLFERRAWEEANLGVAFTQAVGMDGLRVALDKSGSLKDKLLSTAQLESVAEGQSVYLVGLLCSIRMVEGATGAGGGRMSVACVEDLEGSVELVAFPPNYKRQQEFWVEGSLVVVTGRVQRHAEGEVYLLCEHLAPFYSEEEGEMVVKSKTSQKGAAKGGAGGVVAEAEAVAASAAAGAVGKMDAPKSGMGSVPAPVPQPTPSSVPRESEGSGGPGYTLIITLPDVRDDRRAIDAMSDLNGLLRRHPGNDVVRLRIPYSPETGAVTSAMLPWGVRMSGQLEAQIRGLLGPDALAVIRMVG
jgi:DNA polymerase III alpha subunit